MAVQTITVSSDMAAALKLLQAIPIAKLTEIASSASSASCSDPGPPGTEAEMLAFATQEARAVIQKVLTADTQRINALAALEGEADPSKSRLQTGHTSGVTSHLVITRRIVI